jgi:flavin-binding protein dodecin
MSDKALLELAAKAAGIYDECEWFECKEEDGSLVWCLVQGNREWNPLTDDGDALRLAVKLGISLTPYPIYQQDDRHSVIAKQRRTTDTLREINPTEVVEVYGEDPFAATRKAIVRAASEIGRGMECVKQI